MTCPNCERNCGVYWITVDEWLDENNDMWFLEYAYCNCCDAYITSTTTKA